MTRPRLAGTDHNQTLVVRWEGTTESDTVGISDLYDTLAADGDDRICSHLFSVDTNDKVEVRDSASGGFVRASRILRAEGQGDWFELTLALLLPGMSSDQIPARSQDRVIYVTASQVVRLADGKTRRADLLQEDDVLTADSAEFGPGAGWLVTDVSFMGHRMASVYSVQTSSGTFDASGVCLRSSVPFDEAGNAISTQPKRTSAKGASGQPEAPVPDRKPMLKAILIVICAIFVAFPLAMAILSMIMP